MGIDAQYMWSDSLLFTPVLTQDARVVSGYFPKGRWFNLYQPANTENNTYVGRNIIADDAGVYVSFDTALVDTNVHMRGGSIVPMQGFGMTLREAGLTPYNLIVALNAKQEAIGHVYIDDGVQVDRQDYVYMSFQANSGWMNVVREEVRGEGLKLNEVNRGIDKVKIMGINIDNSNDFKKVCKAYMHINDNNKRVVALDVQVHVDETNSLLDLEIDLSHANVFIYNEFELKWNCY